MPYTTVVAGTAITASWGNANVRDQVVTPFTDAATRTSQVGAPIEGMVSYLSDIDQINFHNGTTYVPIPSTVIARANRTTSSSATTSEIGVFSLRVGSLVSGALYKIQTGLIDFYSTVASDLERSAHSLTDPVLIDGRHGQIRGAGLPREDVAVA